MSRLFSNINSNALRGTTRSHRLSFTVCSRRAFLQEGPHSSEEHLRPTDPALVPHHRAQSMRKGTLLKALKSRRNFENSSSSPQMWQMCGFLCVCSIANETRNRKHQQSHKSALLRFLGPSQTPKKLHS